MGQRDWLQFFQNTFLYFFMDKKIQLQDGLLGGWYLLKTCYRSHLNSQVCCLFRIIIQGKTKASEGGKMNPLPCGLSLGVVLNG